MSKKSKRRKRAMKQAQQAVHSAKRIERPSSHIPSLTRSVALVRLFSDCPYVHNYNKSEIALIWLWAAALTDLGEFCIIGTDRWMELTEHVDELYPFMSGNFRASVPRDALIHNDPTAIDWTKGIALSVMEDACLYVMLVDAKRKRWKEQREKQQEQQDDGVCYEGAFC